MLNNSTTAHNFIYNETGKGSNFYSENHGGEMRLYSYSSTLAIKKDDLVIISDRIANYSNTSRRHYSHLLRAIHGGLDVIHVEGLNSFVVNVETLEYHYQILIDLFKKQQRARVANYSHAINKEFKQCDLILKHGNIDKRSKAYKDYIKLKNNIDIDSIIDAAILEEKKAKAAQAKARFDRNKTNYEKFTGVKCELNATELNNFQYLKRDGETIKTSGHVTVNYKDVRKLYIAHKRGEKVLGSKIGHFTIVNIDKKAVKIGCHNILFKEIDRIFQGA